jgi:fumarate reductase flavoprotein subunit
MRAAIKSALCEKGLGVEIYKADVVIVGGGGSGLRAAIAVAESDPSLKIALVSKVYPMRSHTVAAEGGAAGIKRSDDSLEYHFHDTVGGGDWLCEQDVVEYFVEQAPIELTRIEHWGCPWSRTADGHVNVRPFGGMKIQRTWFAADKSGFHILHTLFQTSIKYPSIKRFDEYFCIDLLEEDGRCQGVVAIEMATGEFTMIEGKTVILATGGAGRVFRESTLGGIVTGDGMALAFRHGVALRDMEFMQYHPTCMPITGLLFTEACRGEGGFLVNKDGYRYLQDYGLGPLQDEPKNKYMELGPRDRLSQAFWHEQQKGRTIEHPVFGSVVHLDLRHLGEAYLHERLPLIYEMSETFMGIDPAKDPIPVRPGIHYTMGGIKVDGKCETSLSGLYAIGECASVGIHGANRLGSNSLTELLVFGKLAGDEAAIRAKSVGPGNSASLAKQAQAAEERVLALKNKTGTERISAIRKEMAKSMEDGCGIYRLEETMQQTCDKLIELRKRFKNISLDDRTSVWNTEWLNAIELDYQLDVAQSVVHSAIERKESRGAHQRLDESCVERDDVDFLKHSEAYYVPDSAPRIAYGDVKITKSPPAARVYGAAGEKADAERKTSHV